MTPITALPTELAAMREVVETLAPIERAAGEPGEHKAAEWIVERLRTAGAQDARIEEEQYLDGYPRLHLKLSVIGVAAGVAGLLSRRLRIPAALAGVGAGLAIADDCANGPRIVRKRTETPRTTWNAVAEAGDPAGQLTVVVCAHHDAAHSGKFFEAHIEEVMVELFPGIVERIDTQLPNWWGPILAPALAGVGALRGSRPMMIAGTVGSALAAALFADIARSPVVPGANDNLSAVALLVALAERLRERPVKGVRVLLVSLGGRGNVAGRDLRVPGATQTRAGPRPHILPELRHHRLTRAHHARGRGPDGHGGLLLSAIPGSGHPGGRARRRAAAARHPVAQQYRRGVDEPRRLPDRVLCVDQPAQVGGQLPPDVRYT